MLATRQKVLRNFWYATLPTDALKEGPKPFRLLDQPVVLFLDEKGEPAALEDRCCHRTAKLSKGWIKDGHIVCGYHGWEYDRTGKLVNIPQFPFEQAVPSARAKSFLAKERYGSASASRFSTFRICRRTATPPSAASTSSTTSGAARP
jgi:phenylpropionate dioxygenase-like ring-hydroxylating dioxygenase large terminal subunit